ASPLNLPYFFRAKLCRRRVAGGTWAMILWLGSGAPAPVQTIGEAVDLPGREWSVAGDVQTVSGGELTHDGTDAVRLAVGADGAPGGSIATVIAEPSVV